MKKILIAFLAICLLTLLGLSTIPFLIDYEAIHQKFLNNVKIQIKAGSANPIKIKKFPFPSIIIDSINEEGKIELQNVEIKLSLLSLIKLNPEIANLKIGSARVNLSGKDWNIVNHEKLVMEFVNKGGSAVNIEIANLYLLDETNNPEIIVKNLSLLNDGNFSGAINDVGEFSGFFSKNLDENRLQLKISNSTYNIEVNELYKDQKLISGNVDCQIKNLGNFLISNLPDISSIFSKISNEEIVNIKFNITSDDKLLVFKDLNVNSLSIEGKGQVNLSKAPRTNSLIELNFTKIDMNNLIKEEQNLASMAFKTASRFTFGDKLLKTEIKVDRVNLSSTEKIKNIIFSANLENGKFSIKDFSGQIDDNGNFALNGEIQQNAYRSLFDGKISIKHGDLNRILNSIGYEKAKVDKLIPFTLTTDLKCTIIDFYLQNLLLKTDSLKMNGNLSSKFIGATPRITANLNFSTIDLSKPDYPIISPLQKFVQGLVVDMKNSEYLSKFIPIRTIAYLGNFDITFNDLQIGNTHLGKVNLLLNVSPSSVNIDNLYINSGSNYISTNISLQTKSLKPEFDIKVNDGVLHTNLLTPKSLLNLRNLLLKDYSIDKVLLRIDGELSQLQQGDIIFNDVKFKVENDNILFKFSDIQAKVLSGTFKSEGSMLLEPFTWNFVYALNSIDLGKLSKLLPRGLYDNEGGASINGMFTTNGDTIEKLLYNLYSKSSIVTKDTNIKNLDVDGFVEAFTNKDYNIQNLQTDIKNALLTGQTNISNLESDLELAKGVLTFKNTKFQTKYTSAALAATINIYDFGLNLTSAFSFYPVDRAYGEINRNAPPVKLNIKALGSIFEPQKTADPSELIKSLNIMKK